MMTPSRRVVVEHAPCHYYPFTNTRCRNVLKALNFHGGLDKNVEILLLGCGDLMSMLQVTCNIPDKDLHLHLNDNAPSILARNVLMLKIVSSLDFNPDNQEDIAFLWDLWYNSEWPETTRRRCKVILEDLLLNDALPENLAIPNDKHLQSLKTVWGTWISFLSKDDLESRMLIQKMNKERASFMIHWNKVNNEEDAEDKARYLISTHFSLFLRTVDMNALEMEKNLGNDHDDNLKKKILEESRLYFIKGSCRLQKDIPTVCVNPTLLDPTTRRWEVYDGSCPFNGYLPLSKEELDVSSNDTVLIRSCQGILKNLLSSYRSHLETLKIVIHLEDALELCYAGTQEKFDLIDCSTLADHVGLANLINATSTRLSNNPEAVLLTESINWIHLAHSVEQYVERALCSPISMIPTMYGLRLLDQVELGPKSVPNSCWMSTKPSNLRWQKVLPFRNIDLTPSPVLNRCLEQLARRCFPFRRLTSGSEPGDRCGLSCYTPLTYNYVVSSMTQRLGGDGWFQDSGKRHIAPGFNLSQRTTEAWKNGESITKMMTTIELQGPLDDSLPGGWPALRMVLVPRPTSRFAIFGLMEGIELTPEVFQKLLVDPNSHLIENFQVEIRGALDGKSDALSLSFLLVSDHGLDENYFPIIFDLEKRIPLFIATALKNMKKEEFCLPYPFDLGGTRHPSLATGKHMLVDSCIESEDSYVLKIKIDCSKKISGLQVSTNQKKPCESTHEVTLSLTKPADMKPLTLSLPHPILVEQITSTLDSDDLYVDLILKKALREPWPCEFQVDVQSKWIPDGLQPWEEKKNCFSNSLKNHMLAQSEILRKTPHTAMAYAFRTIRETIESIFTHSLNGCEYFHVQRVGSTGAPEWYLRAHLPIRTSPNGSPILIVSASDNRKWWGDNKSSARGFIEFFTKEKSTSRIIKEHTVEERYVFHTVEELQLWRYILRLNSTKIEPTDWQKENVPLDENSAWLSTFISPLYLDSQIDQERYDELTAASIKMDVEIPLVVDKCCASCKKVQDHLKQCARCRNVLYCSIECQRGHWALHKPTCIKK